MAQQQAQQRTVNGRIASLEGRELSAAAAAPGRPVEGLNSVLSRNRALMGARRTVRQTAPPK